MTPDTMPSRARAYGATAVACLLLSAMLMIMWRATAGDQPLWVAALGITLVLVACTCFGAACAFHETLEILGKPAQAPQGRK